MSLEDVSNQKEIDRVRNNPRPGDVVDNNYVTAIVLAAKDGYVCWKNESKIETAFSGIRTLPHREWLQCFIGDDDSINFETIDREQLELGERLIYEELKKQKSSG